MLFDQATIKEDPGTGGGAWGQTQVGTRAACQDDVTLVWRANKCDGWGEAPTRGPGRGAFAATFGAVRMTVPQERLRGVLAADQTDDLVGLLDDRRCDFAGAGGTAAKNGVNFVGMLHQACHLGRDRGKPLYREFG